MKKQKDVFTPEDLERELVTKDRQTVITQCLKLLESNRFLTVKLTEANMKIGASENVIKGQREELTILKSRTVWQVINDRIMNKINSIRDRKQTYAHYEN